MYFRSRAIRLLALMHNLEARVSRMRAIFSYSRSFAPKNSRREIFPALFIRERRISLSKVSRVVSEYSRNALISRVHTIGINRVIRVEYNE